MEVRKEKLPKMGVKAFFKPETIDEKQRTVELIVTTEKPVIRGFWNRFWEVLDMKPESIRMNRMENGAPLLNNHNRWDLKDQIGVVEKASVEGTEMKATVRFPKAEDDADADKIFRKVKDGIIRNVSVGYVVHKYEKQPAKDPNDKNEVPVYRAVDWEPMEVSLVPVPADENAGVRNERAEGQELFECEIVNERKQEDNFMKDNNPGAQPPVNTPAADDSKKAAEAAVQAELTRGMEIREAVRAAGLDESFADDLVKKQVSADQARKLVIDEIAKKNKGTETKPQNPAASQVTVGEDQKRAAAIAGIESVIMARLDHTAKINEQGREYAGLTLREIARECLKVAGLPTHGNAMEMVGRAFHSTSDFPLILANSVSKSLQKAYAQAPQTWKPLVVETDLPDFKKVTRNQVGDFPALEKVLENGEFKRGTLSEAGEEYQLATYGKIIGVTRQMIINDDLGAVQRVISGIAGSASTLLADMVYAIIKGGHNAITMRDGEFLFSSAHKNIGTSNAAVASGLASMREKLKKQQSLDGRYLNLMPAFLITGVERDDEVEKAMANLYPAQASNDNTFIKKLQHVSDPRLDSAPYFLQASPSQIASIEVGYLQGTGRSIYTEQRMGFDVDGVEVKARLDAAVKALDFRGLVRNAGS